MSNERIEIELTSLWFFLFRIECDFKNSLELSRNWRPSRLHTFFAFLIFSSHIFRCRYWIIFSPSRFSIVASIFMRLPNVCSWNEFREFWRKHIEMHEQGTRRKMKMIKNANWKINSSWKYALGEPKIFFYLRFFSTRLIFSSFLSWKLLLVSCSLRVCVLCFCWLLLFYISFVFGKCVHNWSNLIRFFFALLFGLLRVCVWILVEQQRRFNYFQKFS